jgi:hypothetical protein
MNPAKVAANPSPGKIRLRAHVVVETFKNVGNDDKQFFI